MIELFCIKIHMKQSKVDCSLHPSSQYNMIFAQLVEKFGLETHDNLHQYPCDWVRKEIELRVEN